MRTGEEHEPQERAPRLGSRRRKTALVIDSTSLRVTRELVVGAGGNRCRSTGGLTRLRLGLRPAPTAFVKRILEGVHALGPGRSKQPAGNDGVALEQFDSADGVPQPDIEPGGRVDRP